MLIDDITLLQVNATTIVGIFIFLTVGRIGRNQQEQSISLTHWGVTFALLIPFTLSAMTIMIKDVRPAVSSQIGNLPNWFTLIGFAYILVVFIVLYYVMRLSNR